METLLIMCLQRRTIQQGQPIIQEWDIAGDELTEVRQVTGFARVRASLPQKPLRTVAKHE